MRQVPEVITVTACRRPQSPAPAVLAALDAEGEMTGRGFLVIDEEVLIGRSASCAVRLSDCNVSREHARIAASAGAHILSDLRSKNGTTVNGKMMLGEHALQHGDLVRIAGAVFRYLEDDGRWSAARTPVSGAAVVREDMLTAARRAGRPGKRPPRARRESAR